MDWQHIDDGWYCDALISLEQAVLLPKSQTVATHKGMSMPPLNQLPLFTTITNIGGFKIAGNANSAFGTSVYDEAVGWHLDPRISHGERGCIFDLHGVLKIIEPAPDQTSQGYRYVDPYNVCVLGDSTILWNEVSAYTDLSPFQDKSFVVGQGHNYAGVIIFINGVHRVLFNGSCRDIRARYEVASHACSFAFWELVSQNQFRAHICRCDVGELESLVSIEPPPPQNAPVITVKSWDALLKAGAPWQSTIYEETSKTTIHVEKNSQDQLAWKAENAAGTTQTGLIRQLTVEGPAPVPPSPKPMPMLGRFWGQPNIGSDLLQIFDDVSVLKAHGIDVLTLYAQQLLTDTPTPQLGQNTYPNLVAKDAFRKLVAAGIPLNIEAGSVKPYDCQAANGISGMQQIVQRVADAGGEVACFSMDEPITANQWPISKGGCHLPLEKLADSVASYINAVRALGPMQVYLLEAWPEVTFADHETFLHLLNQRGALPNGLRSDIDYNRAQSEKKDPAAFIRQCQALAAQYSIAYGVFCNSTKDPIATDQEHYTNVLSLGKRIAGIDSHMGHVCVAAWAFRVAGKADTQNVPSNFGAAGMLQLHQDVRGLFSVDTPQPQPTPETDPMLYKLMDGVIRAKELKALGDGKFAAIQPDDRVVSIQPDGSYDTRDPGTYDAYEQCFEKDGILFYEPIAGKRYSYGYRVIP